MNPTISRLTRLAATKIEARRARRELQQLDDRALADLGLTRSDIDAAVRGGFWRRTR